MELVVAGSGLGELATGKGEKKIKERKEKQFSVKANILRFRIVYLLI